MTGTDAIVTETGTRGTVAAASVTMKSMKLTLIAPGRGVITRIGSIAPVVAQTADTRATATGPRVTAAQEMIAVTAIPAEVRVMTGLRTSVSGLTALARRLRLLGM